MAAALIFPKSVQQCDICGGFMMIALYPAGAVLRYKSIRRSLRLARPVHIQAEELRMNRFSSS